MRIPMTMEEEYQNADVPFKKGPNDLEVIIDRLKFKNDMLHKYVNKLMIENKELRDQLEKVVDEYRNKGVL
jgi:predicted RNase H-like nuclease (RuvC/YqgF family)